MSAVERVTADGVFTPDLGGTAKTIDVTKAVRKAILDAAKSGTQQLAPLTQAN
jgi:tartrate dehydrogenase/decarboxylase / D-malate dehydrogenase